MSCPGRFKILSLIEKNPPVGIAPPLPPRDGTGPVILSEPVHIDGVGIWELKPTNKGDNVYQFSISGFEYTGLSKETKNVVIATNTAADNRDWYVQKVEGAPGEVYIIALADDPTQGWTVYGVGPDANIVVEKLPPADVNNETLPNPYYHWFKFYPVLEE